jgi:DNA-binding protein H-NS
VSLFGAIFDHLLLLTGSVMRTTRRKAEPQCDSNVRAKKFGLEAMSVDDLWSLHERISAVLSMRIKTEKRELEKRLAILGRGVASQASNSTELGERARRKYPRVLPKYRNPQTSETWSGRGKRPRWLTAAMKSGHKIEEFRISEGNETGRQQT